MDFETLTEEFKLDITVLSNNRCREVIFKPSPDQDEKQERRVVIWSRARDLANNVYLYQSLRGEYQVVKRVPLRKRAEDRFELSVIGLIKKATEYVHIVLAITVLTCILIHVLCRTHNQKHFIDFKGWFLDQDHIYFMMEYC